MKIKTVGKYTCKIGQNSRENVDLLLKSEPDHLFLHLTSFPSCFVVVDSCLVVHDLELLKKCASICKSNTKYKNVKNVYVDYTKCSNVVNGNNKGEIFYKSLRQTMKIKI